MQRYCQPGKPLPGALPSYAHGNNRRHNEHRREYRREGQSLLQSAAHGSGDHSDEGRSARTAGIAGKRQQREHRRSAPGERPGCGAISTRPHSAYRESANPTADQRQHRNRRECGEHVGEYAQHSAEAHVFQQVDLGAYLRVEYPGSSHQHREEAWSHQVAHRLFHAQGALCKCRSPLAHGKFASPGAHDEYCHQPENPVAAQLAQGHSPGTLLVHFGNRHPGEVDRVQRRDYRPQQRKNAPASLSEREQEERGQKHSPNAAPTIK